MQKSYVLDTSVLAHDPEAFLRFKGGNVIIPMPVLEEMDKLKTGEKEISRNVRQSIRLLDSYRNGQNLPGNGAIFFESYHQNLPIGFDNKADNFIIATAANKDAILVSKDINLRVKARTIGVKAEDYLHDYVGTDLKDGGILSVKWDQLNIDDSWRENNHQFYKGSDYSLRVNRFVETEDQTLLKRAQADHGVWRAVNQFNKVWGLQPKNIEQSAAIDLLLDNDIDLIMLTGKAGTGKTILALAAALHQTFDKNTFKQIIVTRAPVPLGNDIGFLPGTEEEKMAPWMGAITDNMEALISRSDSITMNFVYNRLKVKAVTFMRGRTFMDHYLIIDEAQNLTVKQAKALITRAGNGTKVVCLGNLAQIDTPYLDETSSGLSHLIQKFNGWGHAGWVHLKACERSRLSEKASEVL